MARRSAGQRANQARTAAAQPNTATTAGATSPGAASPAVAAHRGGGAPRRLARYIRANGNMSVERRIAVIKHALIRLGYTDKDAEDIALDAPLNATMYNESAMHTALEYALSVSKPPDQSHQNAVQQALTDRIIPMPKAAMVALDQARKRNTPQNEKVKSAFVQRMQNISSLVSARAQPLFNSVGNMPVPGGLGGLFFINLLFLAAIVPANAQGYTRLELLWATLLNRTRLIGFTPTVAEIPASALTVGALDVAKAAEDISVAISSLGSNAQNVINAIQDPGKMLQAANGEISPSDANTIFQKSQGRSYNVPPSNTGATPPPPPMPPGALAL